ncbi:MAG: pantetheine-phosphate adenylyltransferase [Clostridia bacterium]|nr:pantetheine-phosphate adenylyltransferase [Clostridia bacterium]
MKSNGKVRRAIIPGSYDPITLGHLDIIKRASLLYDEIFVGVLINPDKKYLFSLSEREEMAREACEGIENATVISDTGMLTDLADRLDCSVIVKGVRDQEDFEYEAKMAEYNRKAAPHIETLLMYADGKMKNISSSLLRQLILSGDTSGAKKILPEKVFDMIKNRGYNDTKEN